jgi:hypothetical protein
MLIPIWKKLELWGLAHRDKVESPGKEWKDRNGRAVASKITDQEEIIL